MKDLAFEKLRKQQKQELKQTSQKLRSHGKLKIGVYNNFGHLTINIAKGRDYKLPGSHQPMLTETYVKINMLPDHERCFNQYQTMLSKTTINTNNKKLESVKYAEKYSFEVDQNCYNNRIIISVWSRGAAQTTNYSSLLLSSSSSMSSSASTASLTRGTQDSLIGCFSFRVKTIMSNKTRTESVWFHLLPESFGLNKHLRCRTTKKATTKPEDVKITDVNKDLIGLERLRFKLNRFSEQESFGFTITGNCPCMIGKVDLNKPGFFAGLRPGDYLASVNGKNVSRATTESVVKLVKSCKNGLDIEIYRQKESILNYMSQHSNANYQLNPNQPTVQHVQQQLESVPEEEEEFEIGDELSVSSFSDESREEAQFIVPDSIRHVDSDLSEDDKINLRNSDAEDMRKVAARYFNSHQPHHNPHLRHANIMSLRNLRLNNAQPHPTHTYSLPRLN